MLELDSGQPLAKGGAVAGFGSGRVLGSEHECGAVMNGDRELHQEAAPGRALEGQQPGGCPADRDGLAGLRVRRTLMHGGGGLNGRSGVDRQVLLGRCRVRPCLDAARSQEQVRLEVIVAGGACSVPLLGGLPDEPPPSG